VRRHIFTTQNLLLGQDLVPFDECPAVNVLKLEGKISVNCYGGANS
jgi:hypothetical protein